MAVEHEFPEHDCAVRDWFAMRQWPVVETFGYVDVEIYAWRHRGAQGQYTLHITREVLDATNARDTADLLDVVDAEAALRGLPDGDAVIRYEGARVIVRHFSPPA
jgi:hypothetical protein